MKRILTLLALVALASASDSSCMFKKLAGLAKAGWQKAKTGFDKPQTKATTALAGTCLATAFALKHIKDNTGLNRGTTPTILPYDHQRDWADVKKICIENAKNLYSPLVGIEEIGHGLRMPEATTQVMLVNGTIVGLIHYEYTKKAFAPPYGFIELLAIDKKQTRRGYGTTLLTSAINELQGRSVSDIELLVYPTNNAARALYEQQGFVIGSPTRFVIGDSCVLYRLTCENTDAQKQAIWRYIAKQRIQSLNELRETSLD
jgi:ribosomal protein S18 acetylase RimI-like enzyme